MMNLYAACIMHRLFSELMKLLLCTSTFAVQSATWHIFALRRRANKIINNAWDNLFITSVSWSRSAFFLGNLILVELTNTAVFLHAFPLSLQQV